MLVRKVVLAVATVVAAVAAPLLLLVAPPVAAHHGGVHCGSGVFGCGGQTPGEQDPGGPRGEQTGGQAPPVDYEYFFDQEGTGVGAEPGYEDDGCWGIRAVPAGQGGTYAEAVAQQSAQGENGVLWGNCEVEETIDPEFLATTYWYRAVEPPPPTPLQVRPGRALTGLPAYLEIGGEVPASASFDTPIGTLTFTMTPRYVVSWGDGATVQTESQGGPHPTGDIVHTYTEDGGVTITVEAYWRATWSLAGAGGDLPELPEPTTGTLDLPIEEYQAVID